MGIRLGSKVQDRLTGFTGIAVAKTKWLFGRLDVHVQPQSLVNDHPVKCETFPESQLVCVEKHEEFWNGRPTPKT